jgi:pimeloyl-ACP methyl ester carboxylesterase
MEDVESPAPTPGTSTVTSRDGTSIGYYWVGNGPGLVLLHGAGQTAASFRTLAMDLSPVFTVCVPDRRGRGMSPSYGNFHGLRTETEDLSALLDATGARYVFGLSAGAVIAIETALVRPDITKLAMYEPPLSFDGVVHGAWAPRYEQELAAGKPGSALATVLKGTTDRTGFRLIPRVLLALAFNFVIGHTADRPVPVGSFSPREIIPTVHYDIQTVSDAAGSLDRFAGLKCDVLLLGGSKSARNLIASLDGLSQVLPEAKRVTIHGVGHTAADNTNQPHRVAAELRRFFG